MILFDVVLCTRNPREDYLDRTLRSLAAQTLDASGWRLLLVDSGSNPTVESQFARRFRDRLGESGWGVLREDKSGLVRARCRGLRESSSELVLFIDDDNVLDSQYLENALRLATKYPEIGCFGGSIVPEFESDPAPRCRDYLSALALREVSRDLWSNNYDISTAPYGAGMVVRRSVCEAYLSANPDSERHVLDRDGRGLLGCGDIDLAFHANDLGLGCGVFRALSLVHLIPRSRVQMRYLRRIVFGTGYSTPLLLRKRDQLEHRGLFAVGRLRLSLSRLMLGRTREAIQFLGEAFGAISSR